MKFGRIDLSKTKYTQLSQYIVFADPPIDRLQEIYQSYCRYKKFESVVPLFDSQFSEPNIDVIGYYDSGILVAFSLIKIHDHKNVETVQFAWDYSNPRLRLGISSLQNECSVYKQRGFTYLYLGIANKYKEQFDGFEILGPI